MYKIKPNELQDYIGKRVNAKQLDDILDTYMVLIDAKLVKNKIGIGNFEGVLDKVYKTPIRLSKRNSVLLYYDSFDKDECCEYE